MRFEHSDLNSFEKGLDLFVRLSTFPRVFHECLVSRELLQPFLDPFGCRHWKHLHFLQYTPNFRRRQYSVVRFSRPPPRPKARGASRKCRTVLQSERQKPRLQLREAVPLRYITMSLRIVFRTFRHRFSNILFRKPFCFPTKPTSFVIARRARAPDAAILNGTRRHPGTRHGKARAMIYRRRLYNG